MQYTIALENIEEMRLQEGIDDVELRKEIRGLRVGDFVKLTFLTRTASCETLLVRITGIRGSAYQGTLAKKPTSNGLSELQVGVSIPFTTAHIHSIAKGQPAHG
jgi:hypothetical protein